MFDKQFLKEKSSSNCFVVNTISASLAEEEGERARGHSACSRKRRSIDRYRKGRAGHPKLGPYHQKILLILLFFNYKEI